MKAYENHTEHFDRVDISIDEECYKSAFEVDLINMLCVIGGALATIADIMKEEADSKNVIGDDDAT